VSNEVKIRFSEKELRSMSSEDRKTLFGGTDPFEKDNKFFSFSGMSVGMAFLIAIFLIVITTLVIQFVIKPEIVPPIPHEAFTLPIEESHAARNQDIYIVAAGYWNQSEFEAFIPASERLLSLSELSDDVAARKEIHLYTLKAYIFTEQFDQGRSYAQFIQSRYPDDYMFMSDVFYYRGHINLETLGYKEAYGAFRESHILGGRYSEEAGKAMNTIDRMSRPLW